MRWIEFLKDYDYTINDYPRKANVVADALSRKTSVLMAELVAKKWQLLEYIGDWDTKLELQVDEATTSARLSNLVIRSNFVQHIIDTQMKDAKLTKIYDEVLKDLRPDFKIHSDGGLYFCGRLCVLDDLELKNKILEKSHKSRYSIHPGGTKMYKNLRNMYWWNNMKHEVV